METAVITESLRVIRHSVVADALCVLRRQDSSAVEFRTAAHALARALAYEATRDLPVDPIDIQTPMESTTAHRITEKVIAAPILRAGLGMLQGFLDVVPTAATGFVGLRRNEETLLPHEYYRNFPELGGSHLFLLDPMLATGGTLRAVLRGLPLESIASVSVLSIIAAPEGVRDLSAEFPEVAIYTASLDRCLNECGYILPGLGDAGDRLCQTL